MRQPKLGKNEWKNRKSKKLHKGHWTNLSNADEQRLLGVLDSPVVLLSVVLHVSQLLSVSPVELVRGSFVPGNFVNSVGLVVVTRNRTITTSPEKYNQ